MRLALFTDLHIGYTGESRWHNRKMWTQAPDVALAEVAHINALTPDHVVILGDLTESGELQEVEAAYNILTKLTAPWSVVSGNHDRKAYGSGMLKSVFGNHLLPAYREQDGIGMLFIPELWPQENRQLFKMDWQRLEAEIARIVAAPPRVLVVFAHYPLLSLEAHAAAHDGLYAGHWSDGLELLERLRPTLAGRIVCLCGHQHFHHITQQDGILHCTTASMIEYPMESRLVEVTPSRISIETLLNASPVTAEASLDGVDWVHGTEKDRSFQGSFPLRVTG